MFTRAERCTLPTINAFEIFLIGAVLLGCLSPALTLAALWQQKEWRWDRLMEHLTREGSLRTLFGRARGPVYALYVLFVTFLTALQPPSWSWWLSAIVLLTITVNALFAAAQLGLRRQRTPVWTQKAILLTVLSLAPSVIILAVTLALTRSTSPLAGRALPWFLLFLPVLPALQWLWTILAWSVLKPVDTWAKRRIFTAAWKARGELKNAHVIGIVGCVGKTTTKELIAQLLTDLDPLVTPEHVNTEMGVAQWLLRELPKAKARWGERTPVLVIEMGAYAVGEVELLANVVQPTMGVVTLVSNQHLALFGSEDAILESNRELVRALPASGHLFLNGDDHVTHSLKTIRHLPTTTVGRSAANTLVAHDAEETENGLQFRTLNHTFRTSLHGVHNVTNILLAIAVAQHLGVAATRIGELLANAHGPARTFTVRKDNGITVLDDTHNASERSARAAIAWARERTEKVKVLIFSGIIELGPEQENAHTTLGAEAATVFHQACVLDPTLAPAFQKGFGKPLTPLPALNTLPHGALLVCVGRMPGSIQKRLIPSHT